MIIGVTQKYELPVSFNFIKKEIPAEMFSCEFAKFLTTPFLKNTRSVNCLTTTFRLDKNDVTYIFRLSIFSA